MPFSYHTQRHVFLFTQALLPPKPNFPLADSLPKEAITECKLSSLQLEGILYAVRRTRFTGVMFKWEVLGLFLWPRKNFHLQILIFSPSAPASRGGLWSQERLIVVIVVVGDHPHSTVKKKKKQPASAVLVTII